MIVQRLRDIQNRFGFLPDKELKALAHEIDVPLYRIEEVSSFFPAFKLERTDPPEIEMKVCRDLTCHHRGAGALLNEKTGLPVLAAELSERTGKSICVEGASCLGRCDRAPAVWVEKRPMPEHVHAWVYCGRDGGELEEVLTALAETATRRPRPGRRVRAAHQRQPPVRGRPGQSADPDHPAPRPAGWSLDIYGRQKWPRDYRAVKRFTDYLGGSSARSSRPPASWAARTWRATSSGSTRCCGS
jgi:NADH:ubiquinone oxidoreductase subunit E